MRRPSPIASLLLLTALSLTAMACSSTSAVATSAEPDVAVNQIVRDLAEGRPATLWHALPESYRGDVNGLVRETAERMDAEVWNRSFAVAGKITRLLSEKREFILAHPMIASQIQQRPEIVESWDHFVGLIHDVTHSDLSDLERLRGMNVESFLETTGTSMAERMRLMADKSGEDNEYAQKLAQLDKIVVTVLEHEGDRATLRFEMPDEPTREEVFLRVEGRWVPEKLALAWDEDIAEMRAEIGRMAKLDQDQRAAMLMQLSMVEGALDRVLAAKTAEEFNAGVGAALGMAMGAMMSQGGPAITLPSGP